jgi:hypothetical protein
MKANEGKRKIGDVMAVTVRTRPPVGPARPTQIRVRPAPRTEPISDHELAALGLDAAPMTAPLLPLDLPTGVRVRRPTARPGARRPHAGVPMGDADRREPPRPPVPAAIRLFVSSCVEVMGGFRPVAHLRPFCAPLARDLVAERVLGRPAMQRRPGARRPVATAPPRGGRGHQPAPADRVSDRVSVRRVQLCEVTDLVVELVAVLCRHETVWAMAVRLELIDGRWLCTHLELV